MAKVDIWMPLYIGDYMADTMRLTTEQHGAYLLLLMEQWMTGPLKDDDEELAAITKLPLDRWLSQKEKLSRFFVVEGGEWSQSRLQLEKDAAENRRKSAADNGKKGGRPKAKQNPNETHGFSEGIPSIEPEQNLDGNPQKSSSPSPSYTDKTKNKNLPSEAAATDMVKYSADDFRFAEGMYLEVLKIAPKTKQPNMAKWADDVRLMRERDELTHSEIAAVFRFASRDDFWKTNILSPAKLREKFSALDAKMRNQANAKRNGTSAEKWAIDHDDTSWLADGTQSGDGGAGEPDIPEITGTLHRLEERR